MSWLVCEPRGVRYTGVPCLYSERSAENLKSDPPRCIKHGGILVWLSGCDGLTRAEVRNKMKEDDDACGAKYWDVRR